MKKDKCMVTPCSNHRHQGTFVGNVCVPCLQLAMDIEAGKLNHSYYFQPGVVQFIAKKWKLIVKERRKNE